MVSIEQDPRWQAIIDRDRSFDGRFYYAVKTTGVYCRPSCGARLARRENLLFFDTASDAQRAGYRACKRCKPNETSPREKLTAKMVEICRLIESSDESPSLDQLAEIAGLSPYHFHRTFKAITGVTPKAYAVAHRTKRVQQELTQNSTTVSEAIYNSGFNSNGRFYGATNDMLGMKPKEFKRGGPHTEIRFAVGESSLGSILVAQSDKGVCAILLGDDPEVLVKDLQDRFPKAHLIGGEPGFEALVACVVGFVERPSQGLDLPLDIRGTAFQQRVWQALRGIPVGQTVSYADVAAKIGEPKAVRAVAQACGANALALAIPCHRVVRNDGALSGYRWGVERKRMLMEREAKV